MPASITIPPQGSSFSLNDLEDQIVCNLILRCFKELDYFNESSEYMLMTLDPDADRDL